MSVYTRHGYLLSSTPWLGSFPEWAMKKCGGWPDCDACQGDLVHYQQTGYLRFPPCEVKGCENDMSEMKCPNDKTSCLDHCGEEDHKEKEVTTKMEVQKFERKSFSVAAVQVTSENLDEVAAWCGGEVNRAYVKESNYIKVNVRNPRDEGQTKAHVGDWVLKSKKGFKVYKDRPFKANFDPAVNHNVFGDAQQLAKELNENLKQHPDREFQNIFRVSEEDLEELKVVEVKDAVSGAGRNEN